MFKAFAVKDRNVDKDVILFPYMFELYSKVWYEFCIFCQTKTPTATSFAAVNLPDREKRKQPRFGPEISS